MAKKFRFNLLKKESNSLLDKVYSAFNNYAKNTIILVQIMVLAVFFVKIAMDQVIIDLKEEIDQKNQIILTSESMVLSSNALNEKITYISKIFQEVDDQYKTMNRLLTNIPETVTLSNIQYAETQLTLSGRTTNPIDLKKMQLKINQVAKKDLIINTINKQNNLYTFSAGIK